MLDGVFDLIDENCIIGVCDLLISQSPDVALFEPDVDDDILPDGWRGDGLFIEEEISRKILRKEFVGHFIEKIIVRGRNDWINCLHMPPLVKD